MTKPVLSKKEAEIIAKKRAEKKARRLFKDKVAGKIKKGPKVKKTQTKRKSGPR